MEKIDIADIVHHIPSGEDWVVKSVDEKYVEPAGWPPCRALLSDCRLIEKATPEQRENLRGMKKQPRQSCKCGGLCDSGEPCPAQSW